jgi:hypothetical protein
MRPDPGGNFASDTHRRVLAHLTPPDAEFGWQPLPLLLRLNSDADTPFPPIGEAGLADFDAGQEQLGEVLKDLRKEGLAVCHKGGIWQMTEKGFDLLAGPIANEPDPDEPVKGPAAIAIDPTPIGK